MHDSPRLRVVGVDGRIGPLVEAAVDQLCVDGWLTGSVCSSGLALAYETTDGGAGWFRFHHHHLHISISGQPGGFSGGQPFDGLSHCLTPSCNGPALSADPRRALVRQLKTRVFARP